MGEQFLEAKGIYDIKICVETEITQLWLGNCCSFLFGLLHVQDYTQKC